MSDVSLINDLSAFIIYQPSCKGGLTIAEPIGSLVRSPNIILCKMYSFCITVCKFDVE